MLVKKIHRNSSIKNSKFFVTKNEPFSSNTFARDFHGPQNKRISQHILHSSHFKIMVNSVIGMNAHRNIYPNLPYNPPIINFTCWSRAFLFYHSYSLPTATIWRLISMVVLINNVIASEKYLCIYDYTLLLRIYRCNISLWIRMVMHPSLVHNVLLYKYSAKNWWFN